MILYVILKAHKKQKKQTENFILQVYVRTASADLLTIALICAVLLGLGQLLQIKAPAASNGLSNLQRCQAAGYLTLAAVAKC